MSSIGGARDPDKLRSGLCSAGWYIPVEQFPASRECSFAFKNPLLKDITES